MTEPFHRAAPRYSTAVDVHHGCCELVDGDTGPDHAGTGGNGLVDPGQAHGGAMIHTATFDGPVRVSVEIHDDPTPPDPAAWDATVDHDLLTPGGRVAVAEPHADMPRLPAFEEAEPGARYRLRLHVSGVAAVRALAAEVGGDIPDEPVEHHLLQLWPLHDGPGAQARRADQAGSPTTAARASQPPRPGSPGAMWAQMVGEAESTGETIDRAQQD